MCSTLCVLKEGGPDPELCKTGKHIWPFARKADDLCTCLKKLEITF